MSAEDFLPPLTPLNYLIASMQVLATLANWKLELDAPAAYSKFAHAAAGGGENRHGSKGTLKNVVVSSRTGMLMIYTPALVVSFRSLVRSWRQKSTFTVLAAMLLMHFGKRELEVLFLHKYSGRVSAALSGAIGAFYALNTCLIIYAAGLSPLEPGWNVSLGVGLCLAGQLGNFYHHLLLARLRRGPVGGKVPYMVPSGGLFDYVTMPHYFFELVAWLGIVSIVPRLHVVLVFTGMVSYLGGRSCSSTRWYKERFGGNWPSQRRHLIPWVF